jgi:hypothetical protein
METQQLLKLEKIQKKINENDQNPMLIKNQSKNVT